MWCHNAATDSAPLKGAHVTCHAAPAAALRSPAGGRCRLWQRSSSPALWKCMPRCALARPHLSGAAGRSACSAPHVSCSHACCLPCLLSACCLPAVRQWPVWAASSPEPVALQADCGCNLAHPGNPAAPPTSAQTPLFPAGGDTSGFTDCHMHEPAAIASWSSTRRRLQPVPAALHTCALPASSEQRSCAGAEMRNSSGLSH